jgi:hypothetical protein
VPFLLLPLNIVAMQWWTRGCVAHSWHRAGRNTACRALSELWMLEALIDEFAMLGENGVQVRYACW